MVWVSGNWDVAVILASIIFVFPMLLKWKLKLCWDSNTIFIFDNYTNTYGNNYLQIQKPNTNKYKASSSFSIFSLHMPPFWKRCFQKNCRSELLFAIIQNIVQIYYKPHFHSARWWQRERHKLTLPSLVC